MAVLFGKRVLLRVGPTNIEDGAVEIENLKVVFDIQKDSKPTSNKSKIRVFNPNKETIKKISDEAAAYELFAGYRNDDQLILISSGDVLKVEVKKSGTDRIVEFQCAEGAKSTTEKTMDKSYKPGTSIQTVIQDAVNELGFDVKGVLDKAKDLFTSGFSASGKVKDVLTDLTNKAGLEWFVDNNEIVIKNPENSETIEIPYLTYQTGLISADIKQVNKGTKDKSGIAFRTLIISKIEIGRAIQLADTINEVDGVYQVRTLRIKGDNKDGSFEMTGEAEPVSN